MKRESRQQPEGPERLTITLGKGQKARIAAIARKQRTSAATVIRWALDAYIAANAKGATGKPVGSGA